MPDDGLPTARASDHIRLSRQVAAIAHVQRTLEERVTALEQASADARADLAEAREIDQQLSEAVDALLEDIRGGC